MYFNPRSSCEERLAQFFKSLGLWEFQSTLLMRGATQDFQRLLHSLRNFNPRSSCEERHFPVVIVRKIDYFNPRSSCEERLFRGTECFRVWLFQSTLLMRGATLRDKYFSRGKDISIHAPHARSDLSFRFSHSANPISIHAPHARSDSQENR